MIVVPSRVLLRVGGSVLVSILSQIKEDIRSGPLEYLPLSTLVKGGFWMRRG